MLTYCETRPNLLLYVLKITASSLDSHFHEVSTCHLLKSIIFYHASNLNFNFCEYLIVELMRQLKPDLEAQDGCFVLVRDS